MTTRGTVRLATRGSTLARRQAEQVKRALEDHRYSVELVTVETTGDRLTDELIHRLGKTGAFVRELDEQVLDETVDGAIHSMKDVPTETPDDLVTAAVPRRGPPGDALVTPYGKTLEELPTGATVGTSSLRRRAQVLATRPDLEVEPLRGNVDTRVEKVLAPTLQTIHDKRREDGDETLTEWLDDRSEIELGALERTVDTEYDAIVLAEAGLERSGLAEALEYQSLSRSTFVPAPGQGALTVTARNGALAEEIRSAIDHPRSRVETTVERIVLAELGGGCIAPIGIYAVVQGEYVTTSVAVFDRDGDESVTSSRALPIDHYVEAARSFAADLAEKGAAKLIETARKTDAEREDAMRETASEPGAPTNGEEKQ